jgi:hypothetical protein
VALAAIDRMLEERDDEPLRRARARLLHDLWRRDLDFGRQALVARTPFTPVAPEPAAT